MMINKNSLTELKQFDLIKISENHQKEYFQAHRHEFYEIIYITSGYGKHMIDFKTYELKKNTIHIIKPSQVHEWLLDEFNNEYSGYIFLFSKDFFPYDSVINELFSPSTLPLITVNSTIKKNINNLISMIEDTSYSNNLITSNLFSAVLGYILKLKKDNKEESLNDPRITKLLKLIDDNFIEEKSAFFYANKLELTTKRLNELTKKYLDKTLSSLIVDRNIVEAKRDLIFTQLSVREISESLGFLDSSHFTKYFKKNSSLTPLEFKNTK